MTTTVSHKLFHLSGKAALGFAWLVLTGALVSLALAEEPEKPKADKPADKPEAKNLIVNGDFEAGDTTPTGWQVVDGLTTFWVKDEDPKHGKVLKVDTDVYQSQGYEWWGKIATGKGTAKDAPKKIPTVGEKYDTLAGLDGVWIWSDPIPCEKGKAYWLTLDVKGPEIMCWLVGYPEKPDTAFGADAKAFQEYLRDNVIKKPIDQKRGFDSLIAKYVFRGQLKAGGPNEWKTYSRRELPFRPTAKTPTVKWLRILMLPYWPPATYYIDNVKLTEYEDKGEK
jgi:hypothetical protein